jgi:hypothetical protein
MFYRTNADEARKTKTSKKKKTETETETEKKNATDTAHDMTSLFPEIEIIQCGIGTKRYTEHSRETK